MEGRGNISNCLFSDSLSPPLQNSHSISLLYLSPTQRELNIFLFLWKTSELVVYFSKAKHKVMSLLNNSDCIVFAIPRSQGNSDPIIWINCHSCALLCLFKFGKY